MAKRKQGTLLYGVGIADPIKNASPLERKARKVWGGMLERCYSPVFKNKHPTYYGCSVCIEWLDFNNFKQWFIENYIENYCLDKDLTVPGNKVYSPDTCAFIPQWLNNLLLDSAASKGEYPKGVSYDKGRYKARLSCKGFSKYLGLFDTPELAEQAYKIAKGNYIMEVIETIEIPLNMYRNLRNIANKLLEV